MGYLMLLFLATTQNSCLSPGRNLKFLGLSCQLTGIFCCFPFWATALKQRMLRGVKLLFRNKPAGERLGSHPGPSKHCFVSVSSSFSSVLLSQRSFPCGFLVIFPFPQSLPVCSPGAPLLCHLHASSSANVVATAAVHAGVAEPTGPFLCGDGQHA